MRRFKALTGSLVLLASLAIAPQALATPASGVESKTLATGHLPAVSALTATGPWQALLWTNTDSTLTVTENDVAPAARSVGTATRAPAWSSSRLAPSRSMTATIPPALR